MHRSSEVGAITPADAASFTLTDVRVFDGYGLSEPRTVCVSDGLIAGETGSQVVIDGKGATLLPGLIDSHVHFDAVTNLADFGRWGVTTALDMATRPRELVDSMRGGVGQTDIRSAGSPASAPGGLSTTSNAFDLSTALGGPEEAERFIADRVADGVDYVKLILEDPAEKGPAALTPDTIAALVVAARANGLLTIAHASSTVTFALGVAAGVDILTHSPMNALLSSELIEKIVAEGISVVPTLTMMSGIATKFGLPTGGSGPGYHNAASTVRALKTAGVRIVAGTDANNAPFVPFSPVLGESIHRELELLVEAGLSPAEALRSATVDAASLFHLEDRGVIQPGKRADLLLVDGDPTIDIAATRRIRSVWVAGVQLQR